MFELSKYNVVKFGVIKKRLSGVSCQNTLLAGDVFSKLKIYLERNLWLVRLSERVLQSRNCQLVAWDGQNMRSHHRKQGHHRRL